MLADAFPRRDFGTSIELPPLQASTLMLLRVAKRMPLRVTVGALTRSVHRKGQPLSLSKTAERARHFMPEVMGVSIQPLGSQLRNPGALCTSLA